MVQPSHNTDPRLLLILKSTLDHPRTDLGVTKYLKIEKVKVDETI
jgi:hypothetical protein